jgi:sulfate permease, SulP family
MRLGIQNELGWVVVASRRTDFPAGIYGRGCGPGWCHSIRYFERCSRRRCSDLGRHQDNERIPGVLAFRVESGIVYFNVDHILRVVLEHVEAEGKSIRLVICDLSTSPAVDLAGAKMFLELQTELARREIILRLVEAHASVRDLLRIEGAENRVGRIDRFATVADVIDHFQKGDAQP